jgi:hypothetical protein
MRYHPDPVVFLRENVGELIGYACWTLNRAGIYTSRETVITILAEWRLKRLPRILRTFDQAKGTFETYVRFLLARDLPYLYNHFVNEQRRQLVPTCSYHAIIDSDGTELHEVLGYEDPQITYREMAVDINKFVRYVRGHHVRSSSAKLRIMPFIPTHKSSEIASELNCRNQRISNLLSELRADYHAFMHRSR